MTDPAIPARLEFERGADTVFMTLPGGTRLTARLLNSRGDALSVPVTPSWQVLDTTVASISADGALTPRKAGTTRVAARFTIGGGRVLGDTVVARIIPLVSGE